MTKFTGFTDAHVGEKVTDIYLKKVGIIKDYIIEDGCEVKVTFGDDSYESYTRDGFASTYNIFRRLYFGHNIKVEVTGEEVPEPKLICPVCGVEHEIELDYIGKEEVYEFECDPKCPLWGGYYEHRENAIISMKALIKAMSQ